MPGGIPGPNRFDGSAAELLPLVFARPAEALAGARAVLAGAPTAYDASLAHQAIGLVHREFGRLDAGIGELRRARALARRSGSAEREADVLASLGVALVQAGRSAGGLAALRAGVGVVRGAPAARIRFRLGGALWLLGRQQEALHEVRAAVPVLRRAGDPVWVARALTLRALINLGAGHTDRADADLRAAEELFAQTSQDHDAAVAVHNRALVAFRAGALPAALAGLDEAEQRYRQLGTPMPEVAIDRCAVYLAAGMPGEALAAADAGLRELAHRRGKDTARAELLSAAARAALAGGQPAQALEHAGAAARMFGAQGRPWWQAHARLLVLHARFAGGGASPRLLAQVAAAAGALAELRSPELPGAQVLAGRLARQLGRSGEAERHLAAAARARRAGPAIARADGWLAEALRAEAAGNPRRTLAACRRGLDLLDEHHLTFGATELRARATARGAELAGLALAACLRTGRPRRLLIWSERCRATAFALPAARPPEDRAALADLAALRDVTARIRQVRAQRAGTVLLDREQRRLEQRVRARMLRTPAGRPGAQPRHRLDPARLFAELGPARLVELVEIGGDLHVLVCAAGRVRRLAAGTQRQAAREVELVRWLLRRLAYDTPAGGPVEPLAARLGAIAGALQRTLLGPAVRHLGDGPVVIVPPASLHAVPWAALPALTDRVHAVAPSAVAWLAARTARPPQAGGTVLVRGPDLASRGEEVAVLAGLYGQPRVLQDGAATVQGVLDALDGCSLAHLAAHGTFRADNPMFSSILLDDGPLTVYDLERLRRAPYRIVLPSCDSGMLQPVGADELLGLASALLPLGTAGIVASLVAINDAATVPLMLSLHRALQQGGTLAEALCQARRASSDHPVDRATALSFVALGAA